MIATSCSFSYRRDSQRTSPALVEDDHRDSSFFSRGRLANTLDPHMSSSIPKAIRHVFAEPGTIASNHVRSEQFDPEAAVVLQKCAEKILFVPPATLH